MADNEIIKALENAKLVVNDGDAETLAFFDSLIDFINRQKAENESLKMDLVKCSIRLDNLYKTADEIKSEAIKEFWERLKEEIRCEDDCEYHCYECHFECKDYVISGDNLVKEMTEENENDRA